MENALVELIKSDVENKERLAGIYESLFNEVKYAVSTKIDKEKIDDMLSKIIDIFRENNFSQLLMLSYSRSKENYIVTHITNNVILSTAFGAYLKLSGEDMMDLARCAFAHDFGMIEYTNLFQKGNTLSDKENRILQNHPLKSAGIFEGIYSEKVVRAITDIHEFVNGKGYPNGKTNFEISYLSKIISMCDVFEALTHPRNYRNDISPYEALKLIIKKKDQIFDGRLIKKFVEFLSIYPIGSLVHLNTGETGLVVGSNRGYPTRSIVKILLTAQGDVVGDRKILNLLNDPMLYISGVLQRREEREIHHYLRPRGEIEL